MTTKLKSRTKTKLVGEPEPLPPQDRPELTYEPDPATIIDSDPNHVALFHKYLKNQKKMDRIFKQQDDLISKMVQVVKPNTPVRLGPGRMGVLVDIFADKHTIYRAKATRRFEVKAFGDE